MTPVIDTASWLKRATGLLDASGVPLGRLDCLVLLEDATGKDRAWLLAHPEYVLDSASVKTLDEQVARRAGHEPLAYIRGRSEFYGREFMVTSDTLQPRPETETMIELCKKLVLGDSGTVKAAGKPVIADIGTGSGAIAITIAFELPDTKVYATEVNQAAFDVAVANDNRYETGVDIRPGNLLEPLLETGVMPAILLCNLPYVPSSHVINESAMQEPSIAIFGGEDGLDLYRGLFEQIQHYSDTKTEQKTPKPFYILAESLPFQHPALATLAANYGYQQIEEVDFIQVFRLR